MQNNNSMCADCGRFTQFPVEIDGKLYCAGCIVLCRNCGNAILLQDALENGESYCEECYDEHFTTCNSCQCKLHQVDSYTSEDGDTYCEECYNERYTRCWSCECEILQDDSYTSEDGDTYCSNCYNRHFTTCNGCGCEILREDAYCTDNGIYCEGCYPGEESNEWEESYFRPNDSYAEIGSRRKFGIELETSDCPRHSELNGNTTFGCKTDGSISGMEFISPVLSSDKGLEEIRDFCHQARQFSVNSTCGFHLHLDMREQSIVELKSIAYAYWKTEAIWQSFVVDSRRHNHYCGPIEWHELELAAVDDFSQFACRDRYCWFNIAAYRCHRTFEIRLHTATLVADKVCNWVKAHTRFADWAANHTWAEIDRALESGFSALARIWDDPELTDYFRHRAARFGTTYANPLELV